MNGEIILKEISVMDLDDKFVAEEAIYYSVDGKAPVRLHPRDCIEANALSKVKFYAFSELHEVLAKAKLKREGPHHEVLEGHYEKR